MDPFAGGYLLCGERREHQCQLGALELLRIVSVQLGKLRVTPRNPLVRVDNDSRGALQCLFQYGKEPLLNPEPGRSKVSRRATGDRPNCMNKQM